jgi:hypothetical protein
MFANSNGMWHMSRSKKRERNPTVAGAVEIDDEDSI